MQLSCSTLFGKVSDQGPWDPAGGFSCREIKMPGPGPVSTLRFFVLKRTGSHLKNRDFSAFFRDALRNFHILAPREVRSHFSSN